MGENNIRNFKLNIYTKLSEQSILNRFIHLEKISNDKNYILNFIYFFMIEDDNLIKTLNKKGNSINNDDYINLLNYFDEKYGQDKNIINALVKYFNGIPKIFSYAQKKVEESIYEGDYESLKTFQKANVDILTEYLLMRPMKKIVSGFIQNEGTYNLTIPPFLEKNEIDDYEASINGFISHVVKSNGNMLITFIKEDGKYQEVNIGGLSVKDGIFQNISIPIVKNAIEASGVEMPHCNYIKINCKFLASEKDFS